MTEYKYYRWVWDSDPRIELPIKGFAKAINAPDAVWYRVWDFDEEKGPRVQMYTDSSRWVKSAWDRQGRDFWEDDPNFESSRELVPESEVPDLVKFS